MEAATALPFAADGADVCAPALAAAPAPVVRERPLGEIDDVSIAEWQALAGEAAETNAFAEPWFMLPGLAQFGGDDVRLCEVRSGKTLLGLIPLCPGRRYGRTPVRHVANWTHANSFLGTPLVRRGREREFWTALLRHLDTARWAANLFHLTGIVENGAVHRGLIDAARGLGRTCPTVHRTVRAALESDLPPQAYYEAAVRKKKRKELKRLQMRLAELGSVQARSLEFGEDPGPWIDAFLALERAGWKGKAGSALACEPAKETFFREALAGAAAAGRLDMLRLDLDGRPIAMLVNFLTPPGSFSFKIAFDEDYARFSPGVLIQLENLHILARPDIAWMDSCAAEDHPMIDSIWRERRAVVRVTVRLAGWKSGLVYRCCRALEMASKRRWMVVKAAAAVVALEELA